jgi:hypothetical protein
MAKRQKVWAKKARQRLLLKLGNKCARCGAEENLTFDCIIPCGDRHHRFETSQRMSFYHQQDKLHNIQILCETCQTNKSATENPSLQSWRNEIDAARLAREQNRFSATLAGVTVSALAIGDIPF